MSTSLPPELQQAVTARAAELHVSPEELVRDALRWYLQLDPEFVDELAAWQEVRDDALQRVEDAL